MLVHIETTEGIAQVTLDRPEALNALDAGLLEGLDAAFQRLAEDPLLRAVILTGAGKAFVAGGDIRVMAGLEPGQAEVFARRGQAVFDRIAGFPRPVIAAINGFALGGGCELALACDLRIASEAARLGQPEVSLGLIPGYGGTQRLARLVGPSAAKYLVFTGEIVSAERALQLGLVDEVVPPDGLLPRCRQIAAAIAAQAPIAVALCKRAVNLGAETTLAEGLALEAELFAQAFATADRREGLAAFLAKRPARFQGWVGMELQERLQRVAVIGAAGKMGRGIAFLLAREMTFRSLANPCGSFALHLVDVDQAALEGLLRYLEEQAAKEAERQKPRLQSLGVEPSHFVGELRALLRTGTSLELARDSLLVFEATSESEALKARIYGELAALCPKQAWFFSNTSSIPLGALSEASGLQGRLVGFHFYNPPPVQKLLELITPRGCGENLKSAALDLAGLFGKTVVPAADVAGFIGNGFLMRDGLHALAEVARLGSDCGIPQALWMMDRVTRDWLLRPMGIFQLMDYVGLDVFQQVLAVMDRHLAEPLHSSLLDRLVSLGRKGGEAFEGGQKDGFFRYEKNQPIGLCDPETGDYLPLAQPWAQEAVARLGEHPDASLSWKSLKGDPDRDARLRAYFARFQSLPGLGVELAKRHLQAERRTALRLVEKGVAAGAEDVNRVLRLGFFHLFGPLNDFV